MSAPQHTPLRSTLFSWLKRAMLIVLAFWAAALLLWRFAPPVSTLMLARYVTFRSVERTYVPLERISPHLKAAVIMSEDGQFCRHNGVDWASLRQVMREADADGPSRGASTIPMQTAKNLFLVPWRLSLRKVFEFPLALTLDALWPKRRILEVYLNIAEWGPGLFGAEAAAKRYFGKSAAQLTPREAALLAASLPNPLLRNPAKPHRRHAMLAGIVQNRAAHAGPWLDCLGH